MPDSMISQMLRRKRAPEDPYSVGSSSAPIPTDPLAGYQEPPMAQVGQQAPFSVQQGSNPFMANQGLEQAALGTGMQAPLHPLVQQIMQHLGLMSFLRNRANSNVIDPGMIQG